MRSPLTPRLGLLLNRATRLIWRHSEKRLGKLGLTVAQVPVLGALRKGGPLSQRDLAAIVGIQEPAMAELLGRMERDGFIQRSPDPTDHRSSLSTPTRSALRKLSVAHAVLFYVHREVLAGFTEEEAAQFAGFVQRAVSNLENLDGTEE